MGNVKITGILKASDLMLNINKNFNCKVGNTYPKSEPKCRVKITGKLCHPQSCFDTIEECIKCKKIL